VTGAGRGRVGRGEAARRARGVAVVLALAAAFGCVRSFPPIPAPEGGAVAVASDVALSFQKRTDGFYLRLAHRRFNTLETFSDFILRDYFQSPDLFFDYYADLADSLERAHFDKSRPILVRIESFLFESPGAAQVLVHLEGWDGRPLWPGRVALSRVDRWEWADDTWWLHPGKL
jgi:hypothetical protein